jgi:hypothetical protein
MNIIAKYVHAYLKAHAAGLGAAITLILSDLDNGSLNTWAQWAAIVGAYLGTAAVVSAVPNTPLKAVEAVVKDAVASVAPAAAVQDAPDTPAAS